MLLLVVLVAISHCVSSSIVLEKDSGVPEYWVKGEQVPPQTEIQLSFALKQKALPKLEKIFEAVSDPKSSAYASYLSMEEVQALVAPSSVDTEKVVAWFAPFAKKWKMQNDYVTATFSAADATNLIGCKFHTFTHSLKSNKRVVRCAEPYSVPSNIAESIDLVIGARHFPKLFTSTTSGQERALQVDFAVTPSLLKDRYQIGSVVGKAANNSQSVVQFLGEYFEEADLQEFFYLFLTSAIGNKPTIVGPDGWIAGTEASLDIEYIMSTGQGIPTVFWSHDDSKDPPNADAFFLWLQEVAATPKVPYVFSVSYGEDEVSLSSAYAIRINTEFQKLGLRGVSVLFASGDSGVGGSTFGCPKFVPDFPAGAPAVTAVGGTTLEGWLETGAEIVNGLSGGGFSNYFPRASYQKVDVENYLTSMKGNLPAANKWNSTGRGYPDIAALSSNFVVVQDLVPLPGVAGTSCAAPTAAGIVALLNDLRLQNGKGSLGFLNPLLYEIAKAHPSAITDVKKGSNPGCGTDGFYATTGWDPATGLGSLNYAELAKVILQY